jgi:hypothetical protein
MLEQEKLNQIQKNQMINLKILKKNQKELEQKQKKKNRV